jgi:hypothetical protein
MTPKITIAKDYVPLRAQGNGQFCSDQKKKGRLSWRPLSFRVA